MTPEMANAKCGETIAALSSSCGYHWLSSKDTDVVMLDLSIP